MSKKRSEIQAGLAAQRAGDFRGAAAQYRKALRLQPNNSDALHLLGVALAETGDLENAARVIVRAIGIGGARPDYCANLGRVFQRVQKHQEAAACFRQALAGDPLNADITYQLGRSLAAGGAFEEAARAFEQVTALDPSFAEAHFELGNLLELRGLRDGAAAQYETALALRPDAAAVHYNLGVVRTEQQRPEDAIACYRKAVALRPEYAEAHNNLAILLHQSGSEEEAAAHYEAFFRLAPDDNNACYNLARLLEEGGRTQEAIDAYGKLLERQPHHLNARTNAANCRFMLGDTTGAIAELEAVLEQDPEHVEAHWNLSLALLRSGDLAKGFQEYEWRFRQWPALGRSFDRPRWDGGGLSGRRILLHVEQGMGDAIQFIRYAEAAKRQGGYVLLECPQSLVRLFEGMPWIDEIVDRGSELPPFDCHAPVMSLPHITETSTATHPVGASYLKVDEALLRHWRERVAAAAGAGDLRVGLAWAGNPQQKNNSWRSLPPAELAALDGIEGVSFFSLQKGAAVDGLLPKMSPLAQGFEDFADMAAVMSQLDLVITVDTSVAHVAGALARPCWTLLCHAADWRWFESRDDSPWYPTMRLFRQPKPRDWAHVMAQVRRELEALAPGRR